MISFPISFFFVCPTYFLTILDFLVSSAPHIVQAEALTGAGGRGSVRDATTHADGNNGRPPPAALPPAGGGAAGAARQLRLRHREHGRLVARRAHDVGGAAAVRRRRPAGAAAAEAHHEHYLPDRHRRGQRLPHREPRLRVRPIPPRQFRKPSPICIPFHSYYLLLERKCESPMGLSTLKFLKNSYSHQCQSNV